MNGLFEADFMEYLKAMATLKTGRADAEKVLDTPAQEIYFSILNNLRLKCYEAKANRNA